MVARTSTMVTTGVASSTLLYHPQEKNAFPRHVTFKEEPEFAPNRSPLECLADHNRIWYQETEMKAFRNEVRELCLFIRRHKKCSRDSPVVCCIMANDGCTRGLEQRVCFERQRRRYLGNRGIVAAHKSMQYSPDRLALLASKCNRWASKIAVAEAALDFVQAYYDNDKKRDSEPIQTLNKRSYEEYEEVQVSGRRVRRRLHCSYAPILRESEEGSFS